MGGNSYNGFEKQKQKSKEIRSIAGGKRPTIPVNMKKKRKKFYPMKAMRDNGKGTRHA